MADYYTVLRRAVDALPSRTEDARRGVYDRARATLCQQLASYDPPLSETEAAAQHATLDCAVARLEAELAPPPAPDLPRRGRRGRLWPRDPRAPAAPPPTPAAATGTDSTACIVSPPAGAQGDAAGAGDDHPPAPAPVSNTAPAGGSAAPNGNGRQRGGRRTGRGGPSGSAVRPTRGSAWPTVAALSVFMLIVGGLAAYTVNNRDRLGPLFSGSPAIAASAASLSLPRAAPPVEEELPPKGDEQLTREARTAADRPATASAMPLDPAGRPMPLQRPADPAAEAPATPAAPATTPAASTAPAESSGPAADTVPASETTGPADAAPPAAPTGPVPLRRPVP